MLPRELPDTELRSRFIELMRDLSRHDAVSYAEEIASESSALCILMSVGEADVCMTHLHERAADLVLEFEFGPLPEHRAREALLHLLELNSGLNQRGGAGFGVDANGSTVIFRETVCLAEADRDSMLTSLRARGDQSAIWFQTWHPDLCAV
jgi:hypothetical protein